MRYAHFPAIAELGAVMHYYAFGCRGFSVLGKVQRADGTALLSHFFYCTVRFKL